LSAHDAPTLNFYANEAETYAARSRESDEARMNAFAAYLPPGAKVLELGCGGGQDSAAMLARGLDVVPTDGCAELAREAEKRLRRQVRVLLFEDIEEQNQYDGVWANACLLHVPRGELPSIIGRIQAALTVGGVFHATFKTGLPEGRDRFGRYYNYPSAEWLERIYGSGWRNIDISRAVGSGYDQESTEWLLVTATKE